MKFSIPSCFLTLALIAFLVTAGFANGPRVTWSSVVNAVGSEEGVPLAPGNLVRMGTFTIEASQIEGNASDIDFLDEHFIEFDAAVIGEGVTEIDGRWYRDSLERSTSELGIEGAKIFLWVFDSSEPESAGEHGVFSSSGQGWFFPADEEIPNTTAIDLFQVDEDGIFVGDFGEGELDDEPLFNLAPIIKEIELVIQPTGATHSAEEETGAFNVFTETDWTVQVTSGADWLTIASPDEPASGSGDGAVEYIVEENPTQSSRTGTIEVTADDVTTVFDVFQQAAEEEPDDGIPGDYLGDGWKSSPWFGFFNEITDRWIWHREHGWLYRGESTAALSWWFYSPCLGWVWTGRDYYPFLYSASTGGWLLFHYDQEQDRALYYSFEGSEVGEDVWVFLEEDENWFHVGDCNP